MDDERVLIDAKYEERVRIKHLSMEPSLQGAKARFEFEKHCIEIALPTLPAGDKGKIGDPYAEAEADVWQSDGQIKDIYIYIVSVAVLALKFELPAAAAKHPHIDASLYTANDTQYLDEKSNKLYLLGRRAIDYFLRVVRWKTGLGLIAVDTREDRATLRGGRLFNLSRGGAFYSPPVGRTSVAPQRHQLKVQEWNDIVAALNAGNYPPIWDEYLASARRRIDMNDLTAGTIDLAIAAESAIRQFPGTSMGARNGTMSNILANWLNLGFPPESHSSWFANVQTLFRVRNKLMHRGDDPRVQISFCRDATCAVESLIAALGS
jgi:hypothetical protein